MYFNQVMRLFKKFKTKKQLREEIKHLEEMLACQRFNPCPCIVSCERKNIKTLKCSVSMGRFYGNITEEDVKNEIAWKLLEGIKPFIEHDIKNESNGLHTYTGTIHVVGKDN